MEPFYAVRFDARSHDGGVYHSFAEAEAAAQGGGGGGGGGGGEELFPGPKREGAPRAQPIDKAWVHQKIAELHPTIELDVLQEQALEKVLVQRVNAFITGPGGVGKSFLTKLIIDLLAAHYGTDYPMGSWTDKVMVTASTGIASTHIGGTTIHTALGMGVPKSHNHMGRIWGHDKAIDNRISEKYEVIFIDEISMLSAEMLDALDDTLQQVRHSSLPFGGLQVVMCGDFAQLPPIMDDPKNDEFIPKEKWDFNRCDEFYNVPVIRPARQDRYGQEMTPKDDDKYAQQVLFTNRGLAFQSNAWWNFDLHIVQLTRVFRQDDEELVALLNRMRKGQITDVDLHFMNREFYHQTPAEAAEDALHLYPKNSMVEKRNRECLDRLNSPLETYQCEDFVWPYDCDLIIPMHEKYNGPFRDNRERRNIYLLQNNVPFYRACLASQTVELKIGAKVLLLKNLDLDSVDHKLVNGSSGTVIEWAPLDEPDYDRFEVMVDDGEGGQRIERNPIVNLKPYGSGSTPAKGGGGGGGGGGKRSDSEKRKEEKQQGLVKHTEAIVGRWVEKNKHRIPVVRFMNGRIKAIVPELFREDIVNVGSNCRIQLPLMKGFAVSIHKSQGMTLQEAKVDLQECFDGGQAYVAVSRVGPREGLRFLRPVARSAIKVHPAFLLWSLLLDTMQERRAILLRLLSDDQRLGEREHVASLGLKGLYDAASALPGDKTRWQDLPQPLRQAWCALKFALQALKPVKEAPQGVGGAKRILLWQSLPWKRGGQKVSK